MKRAARLLICATLVVAMVGGVWGCMKTTTTSQETKPATRQVVDPAGRTVTIPVNPKKVATMQGPTYELMFMLGATDQIGLIRSDHATTYPLANLTNPNITKYPTIANVGPQTPVNIEEFISKGVDLVIYWNIQQELDKFEKAGIPVIVISETGFKPKNIEEAMADTKKQVAFLADVLGGDAPKHYAEWESYLNKTTDLILSRTSKIPEDQRPVVFWGNTWNNNFLSTYQLYPRYYELALCGGKLVSVEKGGQFPEVTREQLIAWAPEVILVDNHGRKPQLIIDDLKKDADWASLPAVKNSRIYQIPAGVFFLDKGTTRPLYFYWLSKQLHPDLFQDIDMVKELKYYYKTFYGYDLSTEEAEKVLAGWVAEGTR
ncbi:MAG: ABC transporter substrate-binding protein [Syntrophomonadaceae bacterium]